MTHPNPLNPNDSVTVNVTATATESGSTDSNSTSFSVTFLDDGPIAYDNSVTLLEGTTTGSVTNLLFMLDVSGSMGWDNNLNLNHLKASSIALLEAYQANGGFNVQIVTFDANGHVAPTVYSDLGAATAYINGLSAGGATDYEDAVHDSIEAWNTLTASNPLINSTNSVAYFISDGMPTDGNTGHIQTEHNWNPYVDANFSKAIAVGMGSNAPTDFDLKIVAHTPGGPSGDADDEIYVVNNPALLTDILVGTVVQPTLTGNVITDADIAGTDVSGADGFGVPTLVSVTYDDGNQSTPDTHTFTDTTTPFTIVTDAGTVVIKGDGSYVFTSLPNVAADITDSITYMIKDSDGSTSSANLILTTTDGVPTAVVDAGYTDEGYWERGADAISHDTVIVPASWNPTTITDSGPGNNQNGWPNVGNGGVRSDYISIYADNSHPTTVSFTLGDTNRDGTATLYERVNGPDNVVSSVNFHSYNDNDTITFNNSITSDGEYYVMFTRENKIGTENVDVEKVVYNTYAFTPEYAQTIDVTTPTVEWMNASTAIGNVLDNDLPGTDADLSVSLVNGVDVTGGADIAGNNGVLHIDETGAYTYTPHAADMLSTDLATADEFNYTIVDADGSSSSSTLSIDVANHNYSPDSVSNGTSGDDFIVGTEGVDILDGLGGNDVVYGGAGADALSGGSGNDMIIADSLDTVDGGTGIDSLLIVGGTLDLSNVSNIEVIQLGATSTVAGSGPGLSINAADVMSASESGTLIIESVDDGVTNSINVDETSLAYTGTTDIGGTTYEQYTDGTATLLIDIDEPIDVV
jgi:VCBS repeat-containing protein